MALIKIHVQWCQYDVKGEQSETCFDCNTGSSIQKFSVCFVELHKQSTLVKLTTNYTSRLLLKIAWGGFIKWTLHLLLAQFDKPPETSVSIFSFYSRDVTFCGYSVPHPSESKINLRIQTNGESGWSRPLVPRSSLEMRPDANHVSPFTTQFQISFFF